MVDHVFDHGAAQVRELVGGAGGGSGSSSGGGGPPTSVEAKEISSDLAIARLRGKVDTLTQVLTPKPSTLNPIQREGRYSHAGKPRILPPES